MRYFSGESRDLGRVSALPQADFASLCAEVIVPGIRLGLTRDTFQDLPKRDKDADLDQDRAKRVRYITPAAFKESPSKRTTENVTRCNLIALDIDNPLESLRLLKQNWENCMGEFGFVVWHTASSRPDAPRLRVLVSCEGIPVSRYNDAVRTVADMIGLNVITRESRVVVQPMFLPTWFRDDSESPIIASNPAGDALTAADLMSDAEVDPTDGPVPAAPVSEIADLDFFRTPLEDVTLEDAADALEHLDPDLPMHQWIEVAAGLKHQFEEAGFPLWNTWSAKGKKYEDETETRYRWDSLKAQPRDRVPVTIRTVFKMAQARGWANAALAKRQNSAVLAWLNNPSRSSEELLDQGAKRIAKVGAALGQLERKALMGTLRDLLHTRQMSLSIADVKKAVRHYEMEAAKTSGMPSWVKGLCFVTSVNTFYRHATDRRFVPEVLDLMYATPSTSDEKPMRPRDFAVQIANVTQVEALRYDPAQGSRRFFSVGSVPFVNTYRADFAQPDPTRADEAGEVYWDHVRKLILEEEYAKLLTDFFAYMVQHPGKKVRWAPLLQGGEGCGKSTLAVMMVACLGRRNVGKINGVDVVGGNFNDWAYGKQLLTIEEVRIVGTNRYAVMDRLKPLITDDEIGLNRKHEHHQTVPNNCNYLLLTNHHDSLAIRDDSRRYFVLRSPLQRPEHIEAIGGKEHFDKLYAMIRENPGGLRAWFEKWGISEAFQPEGRAPVTPYLGELADSAASPLHQAVKDAIEDGAHPLVKPDLLSLTCLRGCLDSTRLGVFSDQALGGILREMGWTKAERVTVEGARHQMWTHAEIDDIEKEANGRMTAV